MSDRPVLDDIDSQIIELLRLDARRSTVDIARHVHLSVAPVSRRIQRLEREGVILGYTAVLVESTELIEAFTQIRYAGTMNQDEMLDYLSNIDEVSNVYIMAGNTDALVHLRMGSMSDLSHVIRAIRAHGAPISTTTSVVMAKRSSSGAI